MSAVDVCDAAGRMRDLSEAMLRGARESDWETVWQHQADRDTVIRELFAGPIPEQHQALVAEAINTVLGLDRETTERMRSAREKAAEAVRGARRDREGITAYQRFAG